MTYPVVQRILATTRTDLKTLIGNAPLLRTLAPDTFTDETFGVPTVTDILRELEKPGRDPRPAFRTASFREGVEKLEDLEPGMLLEGVVTNVAAFGASRRHRRASGRAGAHLRNVEDIRQGRAGAGQAGRHRPREGARHRPGPAKNRADDAPRRTRRRGETGTPARERAARRIQANQLGSATHQSRSRRSGCHRRRHRRGLASCGLEAGQARFE